MQVRSISPDEKIAASKIQSIAFSFRSDFTRKEEMANEDADSYKTCRAVFNDNGKMCSCLDLLPYEVIFNRKVVPMTGIGGVATLPEEIGNKYAQHLMACCMREMYDKGDLFSYLYPFSHTYYRKFGYELNMKSKSYSIPLDAFGEFKGRKNIKLHDPEDDNKDIKQVYYQYIQDKNLAVHRKEKNWSRFFDKDPYKDNIYVYVSYNSESKPDAYLRYSVNVKAIDNKDMIINELVWLDADALIGIFAFIGGLSPQYRYVKWTAPDFLDLRLLFPEPYRLECSETTHGMNRVVNVQRCLEFIDAPGFSGNFILDVRDEFFPQNSASYEIEWGNGIIVVSKCSKSADLTCDVKALSQLLTGFVSINDLLRFKKIECHGKTDIAKILFCKKDLFINDRF